MSYICPPEYLALAQQLADLARPMALNYFRAEGLNTDIKADRTPVTIADGQIEIAMRDKITATFPDHGIWGEELGRLHPEAEFQWLLDPIDGTRAFSAGFPLFGVLIALTHKTHGFVLGVCDTPATGDRWHTARGSNVFMNGKAVKARSTKHIDQAIFACTDPLRLPPAILSSIQHLRKNFRITSYGGNCLNYALLASGFIDVLVETGQNLYDIAPFIPMIEQAGGHITLLDGKLNDITGDSIVIAAATPELHRELLGSLKI